MNRRAFIAGASATVATASLAGCSDILGDDGGNSGPDGAVRAYVTAFSDNDSQALRDAIHPDAMAGTGNLSDSDLEGVSMRINAIDVLERNDERATVEAEIETTIQFGDQETAQTETLAFDVRTHDGEWRIYGSRAVSDSSSGN